MVAAAEVERSVRSEKFGRGVHVVHADLGHAVDSRGHVAVEADEIVLVLGVLEKYLHHGIMLVHVIHHGELDLVIFKSLCGNFGRPFLQIQPVTLVVEDSGSVLLRENALAHHAVPVCGAWLQAGDRDFVERTDRLPAHSSEVEIFRSLHIVEIRTVVRSQFNPTYSRPVRGPDHRETVLRDILQIRAAVYLHLCT